VGYVRVARVTGRGIFSSLFHDVLLGSLRAAPISEAICIHTGERYNAGGLIFGEHYSRLCGISFFHAASHSSRLEILAQG